MSDETNSEVKVEAAADVSVLAYVSTDVETKPETPVVNIFAELFEGALSVADSEPPVVPEPPVADPVAEDGSFVHKGHQVRFNDAGDCFISKGGHCLGCPSTDAVAAKKLIDARVKGE